MGGAESRSDLERASWVSMSFLGSVQVSMSWLTRRMMRRLSSAGVGMGSVSGVSGFWDVSGVPGVFVASGDGVRGGISGMLPEVTGGSPWRGREIFSLTGGIAGRGAGVEGMEGMRRFFPSGDWVFWAFFQLSMVVLLMPVSWAQRVVLFPASVASRWSTSCFFSSVYAMFFSFFSKVKRVKEEGCGNVCQFFAVLCCSFAGEVKFINRCYYDRWIDCGCCFCCFGYCRGS